MSYAKVVIFGAGPAGIVTVIEMKICLVEPMVFEQKIDGEPRQ